MHWKIANVMYRHLSTFWLVIGLLWCMAKKNISVTWALSAITEDYPHKCIIFHIAEDDELEIELTTSKFNTKIDIN